MSKSRAGIIFYPTFYFLGLAQSLVISIQKTCQMNEGNILNINFVITVFPEKTIIKCMLCL